MALSFLPTASRTARLLVEGEKWSMLEGTVVVAIARNHTYRFILNSILDLIIEWLLAMASYFRKSAHRISVGA